MLRVGITEAKRQFSEVLRRVSEGETIMITKHGVPVGKIEPLSGKREDLQSVIEQIKEFSKGRTTGGISIKEMIHEGHKY